jgi:hypothetical protein
LELLSRTPNQKTGTKTGTLSSNKIIIYEYEMIVKVELEESKYGLDQVSFFIPGL